jgi:hypothetical protein
MKLSVGSNLKEFLFLSLENSIQEQELSLPIEIRHYILELLLSVKLCLPFDELTTLSETYLVAKSKKYNFQKINFYKKLGDATIVRAGLFPESLNRSVGAEYYRNMGILGYKETYIYSKNKIYDNLSANYDICIDAIHGINILSIKNDVIKLYNFWEKTNSRAAKKRLAKLGLVNTGEIIE